tara:strand:- start:76 stop:336 length:261 start_codon:yes stop_codon:yes gene_type:complete
LGAKKFRKNARVVKVVDGFRWVRWGNIRFCKEKATRRDEINGGDGGGGDGGGGGDDDDDDDDDDDEKKQVMVSLASSLSLLIRSYA